MTVVLMFCRNWCINAGCWIEEHPAAPQQHEGGVWTFTCSLITDLTVSGLHIFNEKL